MKSHQPWTWLAAFIGLCGCDLPYSVLVQVEGIPQNTRSLTVFSNHGMFGNLKPLDPYNLSTPPPAATSLLITFPTTLSGDVAIDVGAHSDIDGRGCILGTGNDKIPEFNAPNDRMRIALQPFVDPVCDGQVPVISGVSPGRANSQGGETVQLDGWGFRPDARVRFGDVPTDRVTFLSASTLQVVVPQHSAFAAAPISVKNGDGRSATLHDSFRYYADPVQFLLSNVATGAAYEDIGGFTAGHFTVGSSIDMAFTLRTKDLVRINSFTHGVVSAPKSYGVGDGSAAGNTYLPTGVVSGDVNGDQVDDLVVANSGSSTVQVMLNDGTGFFRAQPQVGVGAAPHTVALSDLDGDGDLDVVSAERSARTVSVLLNDGRGKLTYSLSYVVRGAPAALAIGDINDDRFPDILVATQGTDGASLLYNSGGGMFFVGYDITTGAAPYGIQLADVDGNGKPDLLVSNSGSNTVMVFVNSKGLFTKNYLLTTDVSPRHMNVSDINGDGYPDLTVAAYGDIAKGIDGGLNFFLNQGGRGFEGATRQRQQTSCTHALAVSVFDIDGDGKPDLGMSGETAPAIGCVALLFNLTP